MSKKSYKTKYAPAAIEKAASRAQIRTMSGIVDVSDRLKKIDFSIMRIRPEFNHRIKPETMSEEEYETDLEIPELASAIYQSNGSHDPLVGDILPDGTFVINEGERRYRAIRSLLEQGLDTYPNGNPVKEVMVLLNPSNFTEKDRFIRHFTSQNKKKLKPIEIAISCLRFKQEFGTTNDEIAQAYGQSRQWADNQILIATMPQDIQNRINNGSLSSSAALSEYREAKKKTKISASAPVLGDVNWDDDDLDAVFPPKQKKQDTEDDDIPSVKDNTVGMPATRLKEDSSSGTVVYKEEEDKIWTRALKLIADHTEKDKSVEFIIGELKAQFVIQNRK